jgi:hypothetical protein
MKRGDFFKGLCIAVAASMLLSKVTFNSNEHDQLTYLYFFSAITLSLFYRSKIYK